MFVFKHQFVLSLLWLVLQMATKKTARRYRRMDVVVEFTCQAEIFKKMYAKLRSSTPRKLKL